MIIYAVIVLITSIVVAFIRNEAHESEKRKAIYKFDKEMRALDRQIDSVKKAGKEFK